MNQHPGKQSKRNPRLSWRHMFTALALVTLVGNPAFAQDSDADESLESLQLQWSKTLDALKEYGADQKDEAAESTRQALDKMDSEIERLEGVNRDRWQEFTAEVKEAQLNALMDMRQQRNELAEWYGAMKHSTEETWESTRDGFISAYDKTLTTIMETPAPETGGGN